MGDGALRICPANKLGRVLGSRKSGLTSMSLLAGEGGRIIDEDCLDELDKSGEGEACLIELDKIEGDGCLIELDMSEGEGDLSELDMRGLLGATLGVEEDLLTMGEGGRM